MLNLQFSLNFLCSDQFFNPGIPLSAASYLPPPDPDPSALPGSALRRALLIPSKEVISAPLLVPSPKEVNPLINPALLPTLRSCRALPPLK